MKMKKEKNVLTKRFAYDYNELDSVAEFLEQKAAEGWELTSKTGVMFGFRKCEPKKVKISVELVYADKGDSERERFVEYCESSGWKHIFSDGKVQIFETEDMDAEPIHSDPEVKLRLIHKKCRMMRMLLPALLVVVILLLWKQWILPIEIEDIFSWTNLLPVVGFPLMGLLMFAYELDYLKWYKRAKECVAKGEHPSYEKTTISKISDKVMLVYILGGILGTNMLDAIYSGDKTLILLCGGIFGTFGLFVLLFTRLSAKNNQDRTGNLPLYIVLSVVLVILVSVIFSGIAMSMDYGEVKEKDMPLLLSDLGVEYEGEADRYLSKSGTFLVTSMGGTDGWLTTEEDDSEFYWDGYIRYELYAINFDGIYDFVLERKCFAERKDYVEVEEPAFGANIVYHSEKTGKWLLLYDKKIIEFETTIELTDVRKQIIGKKLGDEL